MLNVKYAVNDFINSTSRFAIYYKWVILTDSNSGIWKKNKTKQLVLLLIWEAGSSSKHICSIMEDIKLNFWSQQKFLEMVEPHQS